MRAKSDEAAQPVRDRCAHRRPCERERGQAARTRREAAGDVKLINHDLDLSNAVQDTLNTSRQALQQNPNLAGIWTLCDFCLPLMAQVVQQQPDNRKTVVAGLYANPQAIDRHPQGNDRRCLRPTVAVVGLGRDGPGPPEPRQKQSRSEHGRRVQEVQAAVHGPYVIEKKNVGNFGAVIPVYGPDYQTYFTTKWRKEFRVR